MRCFLFSYILLNYNVLFSQSFVTFGYNHEFNSSLINNIGVGVGSLYCLDKTNNKSQITIDYLDSFCYLNCDTNSFSDFFIFKIFVNTMLNTLLFSTSLTGMFALSKNSFFGIGLSLDLFYFQFKILWINFSKNIACRICFKYKKIEFSNSCLLKQIIGLSLNAKTNISNNKNIISSSLPTDDFNDRKQSNQNLSKDSFINKNLNHSYQSQTNRSEFNIDESLNHPYQSQTNRSTFNTDENIIKDNMFAGTATTLQFVTTNQHMPNNDYFNNNKDCLVTANISKSTELVFEDSNN